MKEQNKLDQEADNQDTSSEGSFGLVAPWRATIDRMVRVIKTYPGRALLNAREVGAEEQIDDES